MKNTLKSILALAMVICMLFTIAGCTDGNQNDSSKQTTNEDFFGTTENQINVSGGTSSTGSDSGTSSSNGQSKVESNSSGSGSVTTVLPDANKVGGKPWKDVLASMPKKLRGTNLVMFNWNAATEYTGAPAVMDAFMKQTGIKVVWKTTNYNQYFTKLPALIASGENIPDMARLRGPFPSFVQNMQPLSNAKFDFKDEAWSKQIMDLYTFNGKAFATSLQNTHIGSVNILFYNKELIEKHDFEDPYKLWKADKWTWDKYIEMCEEAMEADYYAGSTGEGHFKVYLLTWGITGPVSFNGKKYTSNFKDPDFLKVHQTLGDCYNKDKVFAHGGHDAFNEGQALFSIGTAVHMRKKNSYFGNLKNANTLYSVPMPSHPELKKYYQGIGEAEAYGIPKGAKNPEAVPYFLRYFLDGSNYELATYFCNEQNLEVYNWCMNAKNKVFGYDYPSGMDAIADGGIQVQTGAQMKTYIDANSGTIDTMVKDYNNIIPKIK